MALKASKLNVLNKKLHKPSLEELSTVLSKGLKEHFEQVSVGVVDCPDLREEPFNLVCPGLSGSSKLLEVGGPPFLLPFYDKTKIYDLKDLIKTIGLDESFVIGAGAGPWPYIGKNCEMIANVKVGSETVESGTRIAKLDACDEKYSVETLPSSETTFALLANLYCSEGKPSKVLKIHCKKRIGGDDFITAIRKSLCEKYKTEPIGFGGAFLMKCGKAKLHIMPSFSKTPLHSDEMLNDWLKFFNMSAPLVSVGTLVSSEIPGMDLRLQHFHSFSNHGEGGHYHIDTTPDEVEYIGYFHLAEEIYRVDKPVKTHSYGRD